MNGPLPKDHLLKCLDGNKLNVEASNWIAIPKGMVPNLYGVNRGARPSYATSPEELRPTILATARLQYEVLRMGPTVAQRAFLGLLRQEATTTRKDLPPADKDEENVRRYCRLKDWAKFGGWKGDTALGWRLTARGRAALSKCRVNSN
jgi:hypothetical protein